MEINGHLLPKKLQKLIQQEKWTFEFDTALLKQLTGSQSKLDFALLSLDGMKRESSFSHLVNDIDLADIYGHASSKQAGRPIHDIEFLDTDMAVLIAVNYDEEAIALDYRISPDAPRVLVGLVIDDLPVRWRMIAQDFDSFASRIGF